MSYYDSETCNAQAISDAIDNNVENPYENCYSHYQSSQIKYVVNAWADDKFDS